MILAAVNTANIGKVGVVTWSDVIECNDDCGNYFNSDVIGVVVEGGDPNNINDVETLYDIHNDFIEVL